ncbi:MAG: TRAP transporter large permease subunit [Proteobacteria bacterium]|nr:TRAP transporter large permease subunit [Pseudomonadota bacterium]
MKLQSALAAVFAPFDAFARGWNKGWRAFKDFCKDVLLLKVVFALILVIGGIYHYIARALSFLDAILDRVETTVIVIATFAMTALVFLTFVERTFSGFELGIDSPTRIALFLMLVMAFLGASLATRDGRHLTIDAADRALSPAGSSRLFRIATFISAVFSWKLFKASSDVVAKHFETEALAKLTVPDWFMEWANNATVWVLNHLVTMQLKIDDEEWFQEIIDAGAAVDIRQNALKIWVPELILPVAFFLMALRFTGKFFQGNDPNVELDEIPARTMKGNAGGASRKDMLLAGLFPGLLLGMLAGLWMGQGWLIVVCAILLMICGAPLFVVIGMAAALCITVLEDRDLSFVAKKMFEATNKEVLLAIPLFVIAGAVMTEGSIARRLIDMAKAAIGWFPGGLAISGVMSCIVFAAISGSSPVTVIAIGSIMVPALIQAKYPERFSVGLLTSAGSLGILIPPSIPMIVYAVVCFQDPSIKSSFTGASPSVNDLFIAGIGPGLMIGVMLALWSTFVARDKTMPIEETIHKLPEAMSRGAWAAGLPALIIIGIYSGWFTATEAAAVSVVYALFVEFVAHPATKAINRKRGAAAPDDPLFELPVTDLPRVFRDSAVVMGSLLLIVVLAIAFNGYLVFEKIPDQAAEWVKSHVDSRVQFLIMVNILLLIIGCLMDILSAILIVAPLLAPIAISQYGIDPIHFGIIFIVNLEIGYLTPPLGLNIFVASSVFDRPVLEVIRSVVPFTLLLVFALIIVTWFPGLTSMLLSPGG